MISVLEAGNARPFGVLKESVMKRLLDMGIGDSAAENAVVLLSAGANGSSTLEERVELLLELARACGNLQNAKLAYSLALRSEVVLDSQTVPLLVNALRHSDCVPAAVRLWKAAEQAGASQAENLVTAARLGENGAEQIRVLNLLKAEPEKEEYASSLARRLSAPGWSSEGSWGTYFDCERGLVWWDFARPQHRRNFGMTLACEPIELRQRLGACFVFLARTEITGTTDRCHLEVSSDGSRWDKLKKFDGVTDWTEYRIDLSEFRNRRVYLRFHVLTGGQRGGRGIEVAGPRLETVAVAAQRTVQFEPVEGWSNTSQVSRLWHAHSSETVLVSEPFEVAQVAAPTIAVETKTASSSAFAEAILELLNSEHQVTSSLRLEGTSDWGQRTLPLPEGFQDGLYRLRMRPRFAARKPEDGFWIRQASLLFGAPEDLQVQVLDGSVEDGFMEKKALLHLLEQGTVSELEKLYRLREGLPSLRSALALTKVVEEESQVPALLVLFSRLGEEAVAAFSTLKELAVDEDLDLQARVLLASGLSEYPSTRDHLGAGLLSGSEFETLCRLYLVVRERWSEADTRHGLSLLLTPIAGEELSARSEKFESLLSLHSRPDDLFAAWEKSW